MTALVIKRVLALPGALDASTMYIVRATDAALAELYFSNEDGSAARHLVNKADIESMISAAVTGGGGNALTADALTTARSIAATGDASWTVNFNGAADATAVLTLAATGVGAGEYFAVTVDAKGRVTAGRALTAADIPSLPGSKITSALTVDTSGNAATATALQTARTINGVTFDGTADIVVNAVDATARVAVSSVGVADGVASLDATGKVPASQLPSFVDDVVEAANLAAFPAIGEASKIYMALDSNFIYRWSGSAYVSITAGVGASDEAVKLSTARSITATGDASWTVNFDGSANVSAAITLGDTGVTAGESIVATYDSKGRALSTRALIAADIPALDYAKVSSAGSVELGASEW